MKNQKGQAPAAPGLLLLSALSATHNCKQTM
jgi:hypothetical protein